MKRATKGVRRRYKAWKAKYNKLEKRLRNLEKQHRAAKRTQDVYKYRLMLLSSKYVLA